MSSTNGENNVKMQSHEIYENLPCQSIVSDSVTKIKNNESIIISNSNQNVATKPNLAKELIYATPLRKSDRFKSRDRSGSHRAVRPSHLEGFSENPHFTEKVNNAESNRCESLPSIEGSNLSSIPNQDPILEQRRIRNFLKDPAVSHKKLEPVSKDNPNSNFSHLAREEHFANLVQQNVITEVRTETEAAMDHVAEPESPSKKSEATEKLDYLTNINNKPSPEKENVVKVSDCDVTRTGDRVYINREWVLKKIAMCLEQRIFKKPIPTPGGSSGSEVTSCLPIETPSGSSAFPPPKASSSSSHHQASNLPQVGCLVLGSNGSGKTSVCRSILEGVSGTRGILNRKLLCCYFINSQNPECNSLSMFVRSLVLQILSHSSYLSTKDEAAGETGTEDLITFEGKKMDKAKIDELEEMLISELKLSERVAEFCAKKSPTGKKTVVRQQSEPMENHGTDNCTGYETHPPGQKAEKQRKPLVEGGEEEQAKMKSPGKKVSKIPVLISSRGSPKVSMSQEENESAGGASGGTEQVTQQNSVTEEQEGTSEADTFSAPEADGRPPMQPMDKEEKVENEEAEAEAAKSPIPAESPIKSEHIPPPLPKSKSCRTIVADGYYEMLISNPEIFESLNVDNIEKNPDECFKKAILFPLLELTPPKTALLFLVDSIDENYINEGSLMSTLKGNRNTTKSRNIAELLSNHVHLFPKWMFLVCTAKKQSKHITKMFTGFKKITLDDLRKSHVVKDVQEYIIVRLNADFKGLINLTKDIIDSLNQLYLKSNGCILYLQKVLNGIKENFFSFREIKLIPCTLNGLYLYICQKSFNKKQYMKIRPILNILLACSSFVDQMFVFNCLRTHNYTIDMDEFHKRLQLMRNIVVFEGDKLKIFHNSFCDWLVDVKFSTKKFLCDVNEGHIMISMYYTLVSDSLCPNKVRRFIYHLIKSGEYLTSKNINLDLILILLDSRTNLSDCFYTNLLNCCKTCENECMNDMNFLPKTQEMLEKFLNSQLNPDLSNFLCDFFKPNLPTDAKTLKMLIEAGINNAESQLSYESSINSPVLSDKSQNIDSELAELLISSERSCHHEVQRSTSHAGGADQSLTLDDASTMQQMSDSHCLDLHKGKALIHLLANEGNHVLLDRALRACKDPIDLEIEDVNGQTALNIASRNGHLEVVRLLLNFTQPLADGTGRVRGVDVNHADRDGWTPLRSASWGGHTEVVRLLISHPGCAIDCADKEGRTALRAAAWSGHEDILKILIEAGANVNSVDKQGRTSLIAASYMGQYDIVEILLENGADVNHLDLDGRSALCVAALCGSSGYNRVISTLLEHGAHTDQLDNDGMSALLVSSFEGNAEICELLLENGADPDLADYMGRTPLWAACTAGHASVVRLLLFWGCSIDCMDSEGRTVLSIASAQGNLESVRQLLDRGLDETHRDNAGWTPLHYGAFEGYADICVQLLESGAKIDECDNEGKTALHLAAQEGHNSVVEALLDIHAACVDQRAHDGKTAFRLACLEGHFDCTQTLLKYGADVNSRDADSRTTLYILALENKVKVVKFLLECANLDVNCADSEGRTALHVAAWQGHAEMVRLLIAAGGADVNAMDLECRTPLHSCAWQGNHEVMDILLCYGAVPDHACKQGATALGISAQEGHEQCVAILLQFGANPYKSDHCGRTPIKLAAKSNRNNVLRILETFAKTNSEAPPIIKSPDRHDKPPIGGNPSPNSSNLLMPNVASATGSTQSSNFYENTMHSDHSSLQKRKSVISSHSTGSSNEVPISFTQQLQKHSRHHGSRSTQSSQGGAIVVTNNSKFSKNAMKHAQVLPNVQEYNQTNIVNEADLFDLGCMSPLYATPPHSPSSDISSPGQHLPAHHFEEIGGGTGGATNQALNSTDQHFARDTHMRIILGNNKDSNSGAKSSKRSGIATNPAVRMIRSRFDSAANLIRRTNNILSSSSNQGSSSIGVKSGTFQWRKESQM
ncbi:ankyrin repeat domain-containing protein 50 [Phlebotomus papatasi]|uniref:ankyrin repeat domain-containing protein 50 n=1 Tax=Phlebotomus papatasi TaxID=29031 RepID=UPI0024842634|nr:ankyrin repeat domain-containing protein 50 [Phlebotomus papatasi]